jgi:hypothetical protein
MAGTKDKVQPDRFADAFNRHGYAFQNKVVSVAQQLYERRRPHAWAFEVSEFPVEVVGYGTRIDFVLWWQHTGYWMLAECKRVNPAYADWFFVRTPYVRRNQSERYIVELATETDGSFKARGASIGNPDPEEVAHIGVEVKSDKHGDSAGGRNAIEEAATQISRGVNGMATFLSENRQALGPSRYRVLIPVIFTTAKLYVGEWDVSAVDLEKGELDVSKLAVKERPFVYYQYHLSPGIKHRASPRPQATDLSTALRSEYIRTIAIVTATGIEPFLTRMHYESFDIRELEMS